MKILILGSGVLGVTTAYVLASRGHSVEVIDRQKNSAAETSFANGGQMSYSHAEPWATPGVLRKLPKWLVHEDSPLVVRPRLDPDMITWGLKFLTNCTAAKAGENTRTLLKLGLYSRAKFQQIFAATKLDFDYGTRGILEFFDSQRDFDDAKKQSALQAKYGCEQRILSASETLSFEPSLEKTARTIVGAIHSHVDETGDPYLYCNALAEYCAREFGTVFRYGVTVKSLRKANGSITGVITDKETFTADAYVMALGSYAPRFLKPLGIRLPIYPMKGYSITVPLTDDAPKLSVMDSSHKVVYTPLGNRLRVAGTAEFAGYNTSLRESRIQPMLRTARKLFPDIDWSQPSSTWACLRPSTPHGPPYLGATPVANLFMNTGHGTLGWTQAAGSAYIVADCIERKPTEIDLQGLTL